MYSYYILDYIYIFVISIHSFLKSTHLLLRNSLFFYNKCQTVPKLILNSFFLQMLSNNFTYQLLTCCKCEFIINLAVNFLRTLNFGYFCCNPSDLNLVFLFFSFFFKLISRCAQRAGFFLTHYTDEQSSTPDFGIFFPSSWEFIPLISMYLSESLVFLAVSRFSLRFSLILLIFRRRLHASSTSG